MQPILLQSNQKNYVLHYASACYKANKPAEEHNFFDMVV